jgi:tetratricopeptide (TPR) repeat protein
MTSTASPTEDSQNDKLTADQLFEQSVHLFNSSDFQGAIHNYCQALEIYIGLEAKFEVARTLNAVGVAYYKQGEISKAIDVYQEARKLVQELENKELEARILNNIGLIFKFRQDYSGALSFYQNSFKIFKELGKASDQISVLDNIGYVYCQMSDHKKARDYYQYALKLLEEVEEYNKDDERKILRNLVHAFRKITESFEDREISSLVSSDTVASSSQETREIRFNASSEKLPKDDSNDGDDRDKEILPRPLPTPKRIIDEPEDDMTSCC